MAKKIGVFFMSHSVFLNKTRFNVFSYFSLNVYYTCGPWLYR